MGDSDDCFVFTWKIVDFSMLPLRHGENLDSPVFTIDKLFETNWQLTLFPRGLDPEGENHVSVYLSRFDFKTNPVHLKVRYRFTLESTDNEKQDIKDEEIGKFDGTDKWGFATFCPRIYLFENKQHLLPENVLTITCRIWPSETKCKDGEGNKSQAFQKSISATTRFEVHRRSFLWPITEINFHEVSTKKESIVVGSFLHKSPSFKVYYCYNDDLLSEYSKIEIQLEKFNEDVDCSFVQCKITVLSADQSYQDSYEDSNFFDVNNLETWYFPDFLKKFNTEERKYLVDNTLHLHFEFSFSCNETYYTADQSTIEILTFDPSLFRIQPSLQLGSLTSSIHELYASQKLCDVTVSVGRKKFPCHKVVLCAQSPVFAAMFENEMREKNNGVVQIKDIDPETVNRMLTFIYSDVMEGNLCFEDTCNLYRAADKYQILPLKGNCSKSLLSSLSVANVCDALELADRHQDHFLLTNVYNFLSIHWCETFHSLHWQIFIEKFPKFSCEIMLQILKRKS